MDRAEITLNPTAFRFDGTAHSSAINGVTLDGTLLTGEDHMDNIPSETAAGTYTVTIVTLTVTDSQGNEVKLVQQSETRYIFTMPARAVTVTASFTVLPSGGTLCDGGADRPPRSFTDLGGMETWYHEAVDFVLRNGLMNGYNSGTFGPNDLITREQLAVMLWRYAGSPAVTDKELHFTDVDKIGGYALDALRWATELSVVNGYSNGELYPKNLSTRAQAAQMLMNFLKNE